MDRQAKIQSLRELASADPSDPLTWYLLGRELIEDGAFAEAAEALARCVALNPDHTAAWRELGRAHEKGERWAEAIDTYKAGIAVAERTRDLQTMKEMLAFLRRVEKRLGPR